MSWMAFQFDISDNATTQDTVNAIIHVVNSDSKNGFIPKLAQALNPAGSKVEYIQRLFDLVCKNVEYDADPPGWEKIFTGTKLFLTAKGDCKKMTTAIAATLKAAGIEPLLKVISYDGYKWSHIYVLARINKKYYVLDPVNNKKFDSEIKHKQAAVFNLLGKFTLMPGTKLSVLGDKAADTAFYKSFTESIRDLSGDLDRSGSAVGSMLGDGGCKDCGLSGSYIDDIVNSSLSGLPDGDDLSELGKKEKKTKAEKKQKLGKILKKVGGLVKKGALQPIRLAFISTVLAAGVLHKLLHFNLAQKMAASWQQDNGAHLSEIWKKFGGSPDALKKAIAKGSHTALTGIAGNGDYIISGLEEYNITQVGVLPLAAIVAAATPIIAAISKALKDKGLIKEGSDEDKALSTTVEAGVDAHKDDGTLPKETADTANSAVPGGAAAAAAAAGGCAAAGGDLNSLAMAILFFVVTFSLIKLYKFLKHEFRF